MEEREAHSDSDTAQLCITYGHNDDGNLDYTFKVPS